MVVGTDTSSAQPGHDVGQVLDVGIGDGDADDLDRSQPGRERPRVVLEEDAEEALDRAEKRAVDHDRSLPGTSAAWYSSSKRCGSWKSTWIVDICHVRPIASLAWTEILGP